MKTIIVLLICSVLAPCQTKDASAFYIKGQRLAIGMSQREVMNSLSQCCKLSPPLEAGVEKRPAVNGVTLGHFIVSKDEGSFGILGGIFFVDGKVVKLTRPLDNEIDTSNEELVSFVRAMKRALPEVPSTALISVQHEPTSNAETYVLRFSFRDGKGIELSIGALDKPSESMNSNKRDFVSMTEILEAPH
jgi:hypothetical protein